RAPRCRRRRRALRRAVLPLLRRHRLVPAAAGCGLGGLDRAPGQGCAPPVDERQRRRQLGGLGPDGEPRSLLRGPPPGCRGRRLPRRAGRGIRRPGRRVRHRRPGLAPARHDGARQAAPARRGGRRPAARGPPMTPYGPAVARATALAAALVLAAGAACSGGGPPVASTGFGVYVAQAGTAERGTRFVYELPAPLEDY